MSKSFGMKGYMKGALLLTLSALIVKALSAVYRVPFQNLVGDQGFYVYQQVYPFISLFVVWTSGGFAVAISKMLADADIGKKGTHHQKGFISRTIFQYLTVLSLIFFAILFFGAEWLATLMGDQELALLLRTGSFVTLFMPILSLMKGIFQSKGEMTPVAYAQVFEQAIRVSIILIGAILVMTTSKSLYLAGNMAILGTVIGEIAGVLLLIYYTKKLTAIPRLKNNHRQKKWPIIKEVTALSLSVSMSSLLLLGFQLIDSFTVYSLLLETGMDEQTAKITKGIYDRGQPLVQLGIIIASSLSLAIVPLVAHYSKKQSGRGAIPFIQLTFRSSIIFGFAAALGLVIVMPYVNEMLFETNSLSVILRIYVLQIIPLSIILTFTAILQGYGKLKIPAFTLIGVLLLKVIGNFTLIPKISLLGVALTSNIALFLCAFILMIYLKRVTKVRYASSDFYIKLLFASLSMIISVFVSEQILIFTFEGLISGRLKAVFFTLCLVGIGAFVFLTFVAKSRMLVEKEWFLLPFGRKMAGYQLWLNKKK